MSRILVVGASGNVGSKLVDILKSEGHQVLSATSKKTPASGQVNVDLHTRDGLAEAVAQVERVFALSPGGHLNQHQLLTPVIEEATRRRVKKFVLMTAIGVNADDANPLRRAEIALERSGLDYNILRPNWFMQNFNTFWLAGIRAQGKILLPTGDAKGSFIDARDIAAVAAALLVDDTRFNKRAFDLTGADVLNHDEVAALLTKASGKAVRYQEISPPEMERLLVTNGASSEFARFMLMLLDFFKKGYFEGVTSSVEEILGRKPIGFAQYAADYRASWI